MHERGGEAFGLVAGPRTIANKVPCFGKSCDQAANTYASLSAKSNGVRLHRGGKKPQQEGHKARDTGTWQREDKRHSPYSLSDSPGSLGVTPLAGRWRLEANCMKKKIAQLLKQVQGEQVHDHTQDSRDRAAKFTSEFARLQQQVGSLEKSLMAYNQDRQAYNVSLSDMASNDKLLTALWRDIEAVEKELPRNFEQKRGPDKLHQSLIDVGPERNSISDRPDWNERHHLTYSMVNPEMKSCEREYFDKPKQRCNDAWDRIPRMRQTGCTSDRGLLWDDQPAPLGQARRTCNDHIEPTNSIGGWHQHQLPSFWRSIGNWHSFSTPDLRLSSMSLSQNRSPLGQHRSLLESLADTPAKSATEFWRGWANSRPNAGLQPSQQERVALRPDPRLPSAVVVKGEPVAKDGDLVYLGGGHYRGFEARNTMSDSEGNWNERWNVTWSKDNERWCHQQREYFSVAKGGLGRATVDAPVPFSSDKNRGVGAAGKTA